MSNHIEHNTELYELITNLKKNNFKKKSITIIGTGRMAQEYAKALKKFQISNVIIMGRNKEKVKKISSKFDYYPVFGSLKKNILKLPIQDLIIVAVSVNALSPTVKLLLENDFQNILVEKPGGLYKNELKNVKKIILNQNVRIAYNRLAYPNVILLKELIEKDGGATSCFFSITEKTHLIKNINTRSDVFQRWGISNSLHVITLVSEIIGKFKKISPIQTGSLKWHKSGSKFFGTGITSENIPFSYHSDWESIGGWEIQVFTKNHIFKLNPLETLQIKNRDERKWREIKFKITYRDIKQGIAEEIFLMLHKDQEMNVLPKLDKGIKFIEIAEKIFGYKSL